MNTNISVTVDDFDPKIGDYLIITPNVTSEGVAVSEGIVEIYVNDILVNTTTAGSICEFYDLNKAETIEMYAIYKGSDNYNNSTSEKITITIHDNRIPSLLILTSDADEVYVGDSIVIYNKITNATELDYWTSFASQFNREYNYAMSEYIPTEKITIFLNGEILNTTLVNPNGIYQLNYTFDGFDKEGWYNFTASFDGNDKVQGSNTTEILSFYVVERPKIVPNITIDVNKTEGNYDILVNL